MSPSSVIFKLKEIKEKQITESKREAIDRAIKAVEAHDVAMEVSEDGKGSEIYLCPSCDTQVGCMCHGIGNYCPNCGQRLKEPKE